MNKGFFFLFFFLFFLSFILKGQSEFPNTNNQNKENNLLLSPFYDTITFLDLSKKKLKEVPKEVLLMKSLEKLIIKQNYIKEIPKELSLLKNLHYLDLSSNYIETLPKELSLLNIDTLIMWDNKIKSFYKEFSLWGNTLLYLDMRAIQMNRKQQKSIKALFPNAKIRMAYPCNCN
ncbi:MAG: hypothetical protein LBM25_05535 [Bacteroidales bacterium]|jgi:hypothetical protein|nr:hypothetical protein [Bacteroidales bacterium]